MCKAVSALDEFLEVCAEFAARRRAAVARARATIEVTGTVNRSSAVSLLVDVMAPSARVDV